MIKIVGLWIAVIWFTALHSPFGSMIAIILFFFYWSYFTPFYPNSNLSAASANRVTPTRSQ